MILLLVAGSLLPAQYVMSQENPDNTFTLNLQNVDIRALIKTVSIKTGTNFIVDPRVKATVNVVSSKPVNADKLYEIFLSVLEVHGYAAVKSGQVTKIVPSSVGVQSALPLLSDSASAADKLVTQIIPLYSLPATEVVKALQPLLAATASITAESSSNSIVVTDRAANIEKLIELIIMMDNG